jgi:carbon storage regulator
MLVISRRLGEGIVINGDIHITVVKVGRGRIRLGLNAPSSVRIHRREELDGKMSHGMESLGGTYVSDGVLPFSLREPAHEADGEVLPRRSQGLPELVGSEHGTGDSHRSCR